MESSCAIKDIVRHHLFMKRGSSPDNTFPDCMMTFVYGWGKTNIQRACRENELALLDESDWKTCKATSTPIADYLVTPAERYKHITNKMFMNVKQGAQAGLTHPPFLKYDRQWHLRHSRKNSGFSQGSTTWSSTKDCPSSSPSSSRLTTLGALIGGGEGGGIFGGVLGQSAMADKAA